MSFVLVFANTGFTVGALVSGFLFDIFSEVLQLAICIPVLAILTIITPFMKTVYLFTAVIACSNVVQGYIRSGSISYILKLWIDHKYKQPLFHTLHTVRCLGAFAFPFIAIPFLADLPGEVDNPILLNETDYSVTQNCTPVSLSNMSNYIGDCINTSGDSNETSYTVPNSPEDVENVKYVFVLVGIAYIITSLFCTILACILQPPIFQSNIGLKRTVVSADAKEEKHKNTLKYKFYIISIFILVLVFSGFYGFYDYMLGSMMYAIAFRGLQFGSKESSILVSVFYGTQCIGRIISIPASSIMSISKIIFINITCTIIGLIIMMFVLLNVNLIWIATAIVGVFVSSTIPSIQLWLSDYITVTGSVSSALFVVISISSIGGLVVVGHLFQNFGHMSVMYMAMATSVLNALIFIALTGISTQLKKHN